MADPTGDPFAASENDEVWEVVVPGVPEGKYPAYVSSAERQFSQNTGNPMFVLKFVIAEPPHAGEEYTTYIVDTKASKWRVVNTFEALGIRITENEPVKITKSDLLRRGAIIELKKDSYQGKVRLAITNILPHPNGAGYKYEGGVGATEAFATPAAPATAPVATPRAAAPQPDFKEQKTVEEGQRQEDGTIPGLT